MKTNTLASKWFRPYTSLLALTLAACGGSVDASKTESTSAPLVKPILDQDGIFYLQQKPIASVGATPVTLANGRQLRVDIAAATALARHRQLEQEVAGATSALLAPATTTEEFIETPMTVRLVATTHMVVVDPALLRTASPIAASLHLKGAAARPFSTLTTEERTWLQSFRQTCLLLPRSHPLGAAARVGLAALWNAGMDGKGDLTITTTAEVPTAKLVLNGSTVNGPAFVNGGFDYQNTLPNVMSGFNSGGPNWEETLMTGLASSTGEIETVTQFVNGYQQGDAWEWKEHWDFGIGKFTFKAGAWYAVGLRIPIKVTGTMTPADITKEGGATDDESSFTTKLSVDVVDGDEDFYADAGLPTSELAHGHELVAEGGAYVTIDLDLPGSAADIHQSIPGNPGFDGGEDFTPPFGDCGTDCGFDVFLPSSLTHTGIDVLGIVKGEAKIGFNISGQGTVALTYESLYDGLKTKSTFDGATKLTHDAEFENWAKQSASTVLSPLTEHGTKSFGYRLSDLDYTWSIELTPAVTADVGVNCVFLDWTENLGTIYLDFAAFSIGSITLPTLDGTRTEKTVTDGTKSWVTMNSGTCGSYTPPGDGKDGAGGGLIPNIGGQPPQNFDPSTSDINCGDPADQIQP